MVKKEEETSEQEPPKPSKEIKEPRVLVVKTKDIPTQEIREAELGGQPIIIENLHEAITEMRNDIREMKKSLTG